MDTMICCPFCSTEVDHAGRCSNVNCFMWFTIVPLPDEKPVEYEVCNAAGDIIFRA